MKPEDLAAIEARAAAATPAPWRWQHARFNDRAKKMTRRTTKANQWLELLTGGVSVQEAFDTEMGIERVDRARCEDPWDYTHVLAIPWSVLKGSTVINVGVAHDEDEVFIAAAREDVPALAAALKDAWDEIARLRTALAEKEAGR